MTARDRREPTVFHGTETEFCQSLTLGVQRGLLLVSVPAADISCDRSLFKGELHDPFQYQFIHLAVGNGVKRFWRYCHLLTAPGRQVPFLAHSHHMGVCSFMLMIDF
ncbi:hypothetical protein NEUTE1DRAFT_43812 [Neurospora tetrasperma FGSC 2508]|uniref:Uncharacterized protein n=1 Tax=Neurospora tetrasperma (strain FGSC 2508 / ATCC MYA-4615 / P0657) TaxID=510951 RepID=F8MR12_NEUT8|nr:uncharacterized protein NEUTE1DRAFT_43812 [Neurospora tetrasperma FGSC 2508]EGO56792.1 hypothetical protein NEUTE1DRAFT_43812 [Neurospora tetrasperma FGSC 2508]EGZ70320.1 hypothetical protein NEUTE2DRAFT_130328 [Neurospora tetrasperma FGSC 2509]